MIKIVWATWTQVGFHLWPKAPPHRAYLASRHRHLFEFQVEVAVQMNDRQVEFHDLADKGKGLYENREDFGSMSCEDMAEGLIRHLAAVYPNTKIAVTVSEDGECGATLRME